MKDMKPATGPHPDNTRCACASLCAYECWAVRYKTPAGVSVMDEGGPCECQCHDHWEWDDEEEDWI